MSTLFNRNYMDEIRYKLENLEFEGPLDLLVTMVDKEEMDIREIPISKLTDQYLEYINGLEQIDYEYAAEFIAMAARLIKIKSFILIPRPEEEVCEEQEEIYRDFEEYKMFKGLAEKLKSGEVLNRFYREPQYTEDDYRVVIKNFDLDKLTSALLKVMDRIETSIQAPKPREILKEKITVAQKMGYLKELMLKYKEVCFFDLFSDDSTVSDVLNTFLAILELLKEQIAVAEQPDAFGDIMIRVNDNFDFTIEGDGAHVEEYN